MRKYKYIVFLLVFTLVINCAKDDKLDVDVSNIKVNTIIKRFDQEFYTSKTSDLSKLKNNYPYLFPSHNPDSVWVHKMKDKDEQELYAETQKLYNNFNDEKEQLTNLFKHVKYYYPNFNPPKVITVLTNVDYESKVIYADSLLLISLDMYLGKDNNIYEDFPDYIKNDFTKDHLIVDVAKAITKVQIPLSSDRTFISRMIQKGKEMYLLDAYLPNLSDAQKIGYTQDQLDWAKYNDEDVWKYFVQNKLLFSSDPELTRRFIVKAPFSKFYQANDNESPGSIGVWFGWQIVRAYMQHNTTTLQEMLRTKNEEIFKKSKYKPTK